MLIFRRIRSLRTFASVHSLIHDIFNTARTLSSRKFYNLKRAAALTEWRGLCAT
jgi:putative transposase